MSDDRTDPQGVTIERLSKTFDGVTAVDAVDLEIRSGQFFSLLGPSGCGKTTLLRMLGGFERPSGGRVSIGGVDVTALPPEKRPTNMVFQSYALFPHLDVGANVGYGLGNEGLDQATRRQRVAEALALVQLQGLDRRRPAELSGGQRQRVALARALVKRPKVLLLDEPLAALDKRLREAMQRELRELQRRVGITFVFVTHDQDEAFAMSDQIAVMERGRILQVASPDDLYRRPNSAAVASFIGSVNLLRGTLLRTTPPRVAVDGFGELDSAATAATAASISAAIRPEQLQVCTAATPPTSRSVRGTVVGTTYLGERSYVTLIVPGVAQVITACMLAPPGATRPADGSGVWLDVTGEVGIVTA